MVTRKRDDSKLCISWILKTALKDFGPITRYGHTIIIWKFLEGHVSYKILKDAESIPDWYDLFYIMLL